MSADYFPRETLEYLSVLRTGLLELGQELKNKAATKEETVEMDSDIWSKLPQELLRRVITQLPTLFSVRFRAVCKGWKHILSPAYNYQIIPSTVIREFPFPAFLISGVRCSYMRGLQPSPCTFKEDLTLLQASASPLIHKLSLNFCPYKINSVLSSCKSVLCCFSLVERKITLFICNPTTKTFKTLPSITLYIFDFCGFTFHPSTRTFMLVIGWSDCSNSWGNNMHLNMYDSVSDTWTQLQIDLPTSICPRGEGVFSRGRFYWINNNRLTTSFDVVLFDVEAKHWETIRQPERKLDAEDSTWPPTQCFWKLTGHDMNVVLVYLKDISMWKLNEGEEYSWSEMQAFPRILYRHSTARHHHVRWLKFKHPQVVVNSCGWVLLLMHGYTFIVFDAKGRMMMNTRLKLERCYEKSDYQLSFHAYEINNIWWP